MLFQNDEKPIDVIGAARDLSEDDEDRVRQILQAAMDKSQTKNWLKFPVLTLIVLVIRSFVWVKVGWLYIPLRCVAMAW